MRLLLTRPREDSAALAKILRARGHEPLVEPLLDIRFDDDVTIDASRYRAVLATSANGIRGLMRTRAIAPLRALPLFAVGPATARQARAAGFEEVHTAGGDVDKLGAFIAGNLPAAGKPLLHVSGKAAAGDLKAMLATHGFDVERIILYEAVKATGFSPAARALLRLPGGVLLYSPRTAAIFTKLAAALGDLSPELHFYCLSPAVADKLTALKFKTIHVARRPDQKALLDLL
ncbi:MAG TPA: uroporphyrinogen-III synthase [Rhodobacteraceae bacterium]|nr:uroporphyrinogen-III synthase [Paracoccaceae bacterium]